MDQHSLVCALKDLAIELGRTPTKIEFIEKRNASEYMIKKYGGYTTLVMAADLSPYHVTKRVVSFERDLGEVLAQHEPREPVAQTEYTDTLAIGDTHFPFTDERCLDGIYAWAEKMRPKRIVQVGDLYDMYGSSKFPRSLNVYKPVEEEDLGRKKAEKMWSTLRGLCPDAECVQLKGNHDIRPLKRTLEHVPALEHVVARHLDLLMTFEGVRLVSDPRQEFITEGIQFIHGYKSRLGDHRDHTLMHSVCGHSHVGGVVFRRLRGQTLWELNCGFVGDAESKALGYTPQRLTNWTPGFGWIDKRGPRFIPL